MLDSLSMVKNHLMALKNDKNSSTSLVLEEKNSPEEIITESVDNDVYKSPEEPPSLFTSIFSDIESESE